MFQNIQPGDRAGRYVILQRLESEGVTEHFLAQDPKTQVQVNLHHVPLHSDDALRRECVRFAKTAQAMVHRNLAFSFEHWVDEDSFFLAQEKVEGTDLETYASSLPHDDITRLIRIFRDVARAIDELHMNGIILGRITPSDIVVDAAGAPRLVNFFRLTSERNTARVLKRVASLATVASVSPEERLGGPPSLSTDVFIFGVLMYEIFTGALPFSFDGYRALERTPVQPRIDPPSFLNKRISPELDRTLLATLEMDHSKRTRSFRALSTQLSFLLGTDAPLRHAS